MSGRFILFISVFMIITAGCYDAKNSKPEQSLVTIKDLLHHFKSKGFIIEDAPMSERDKNFVKKTKKGLIALNKAWGVKTSKKTIINIEYSSVKINGIKIRIKRYASPEDAKIKYNHLIAHQAKYPPKPESMTYYHCHGPFLLTTRNFTIKLGDTGAIIPQKIKLNNLALQKIWNASDNFKIK